MITQTLADQPFDRSLFEAVLRRRLFFTEAFEIYRTASNFNGDNKGLYDYGPPGCGLQANIVDLWRKHFVVEEDMLEMDCTVLTPEDVFKTSGHVDKFADWMCKDPVKGDYLRADHLIEAVLSARLDADRRARGLEVAMNGSSAAAKTNKLAPTELKAVRLGDGIVKEYEELLAQIDNFDGDGLADLIKRLDIRNPNGNGEVLPPAPFNLMFKSTIGPSSAAPVYLRPETAQGQFLNFKKLIDYNQNIMPFASASIGKSYRNEISPRSGLLRVREFLMAEIEHFVDPQQGKRHERFAEVKDIQLPLLDRDTQLSGSTTPKTMSIEQAVKDRIVDNESLGYFLTRIQEFLLKIGIDQRKLRFRQHLPNEMAHYACDCWDAELLSSYGWIECVGCADRSAFDLTVHMRRTEEKLVVRETLPEPRKVIKWQTSINKRTLGKAFRSDAKIIEKVVLELDEATLAGLSQQLAEKGSISLPVPALSNGEKVVDLRNDMLSIELNEHVENIREYTPNVIEPSFGIGRILYCLLEHSYWYRNNDVARAVFSLPLSMAPTKVLLVPLSPNALFTPIIRELSAKLRKLGINTRVDGTGASIGKRYSRNDELGTPLGITVDFDTVKDGSVTLRERDSTKQVRGSRDDILAAIQNLVSGHETWQEVSQRLPEFVVGKED